MKNESPVIQEARPFGFGLFRWFRVAFPLPRFVISICLVVLCGLDTPASWAQGSTAVVAGARRLLVRRGPAKSYAPFAILSTGTKVEVQEMEGEWAHIVMPGGQAGYVNSTFLALPNEKRRAAPTPTATPSGLPPTATPRASESTALRTPNERNPSLETDVRSLREEVATLKSRAEATPAAAPVAAAAVETEQLRSDLKRLSTAVEGLQRRLDARPMTEGSLPIAAVPAEGSPPVVSPMAILLGGVGLSVGWLVGSAYSRRQERGRRSRIRF